MQNFLSHYSRCICLGLALLLAVILSVHIALGPVIPVLDGEGYAMRTFALYGDLHTGEWRAFGDLLERPKQSILVPHDLLFFLLPPSLAGTVGYASLQLAATYLLLAYAIWKAATVLHRPAWAPVIFLLVGVNNIALTDFYDFYLDMMFCAGGFLVIAFQMKAWQENRAQASMLAGALLGLLFFLKPANALLFLTTYILSELFYAMGALRSCATKNDRRSCLLNLVRQGGYRFAGFLPAIIAVGLYGGAQTILLLIDQNEVHEEFSPVAVGGLLRLLYFPLCLAVCYHVLLLVGLILATMAFSWSRPTQEREEIRPGFPMELLLPVMLSYLILGEFFSFWLLAKPVRALLLTLPLFGFLVCWCWERRRLRFAPLAFAAVIYAVAALSQKAFGFWPGHDELLEDTYQLTWSSFVEMPSAWRRGSSLNLTICDFISRDAPPSGVICVNALELRNALAWRLNNGELLLGKLPRYEVRTLFDYRGKYYEKALNGANLVSLITFRPVQSTRAGWLRSMGIVNYGEDEWCAKGRARLSVMPSIRGETIGYDFIFDQPLTPAEVDRVNQSAAFAGATYDPTVLPDAFTGHHYSRVEAWQLLRQWFDKRF